MKYIRTKDGIYEVSKDENDDFIVKNKGSNTWCLYSIFKEKYDRIIPADTIEELCDEFVVKHINNEKPYITDNYQKHDLLKDRQKAYEYGVEIVYAAIWTKLGLEYVAKMNSKGELELL